MSRTRRIVVWSLIVAAAVIGVASILTTWVHRQMLDEQSWRDASEQLIEDPAIRDTVAAYVVDELYANVNLTQDLDDRLPESLKPLAGTLVGALREPATNAVARSLEAPRVQQLFIDASVLTQQKLVNVLENKTGHGITTGNGDVTIDLGELVDEIAKELGLPQAVVDAIPPDAGVVTIMRSDQLATAQAGVQAVRVLSTALLVLVLGLLALAVYLARGERRETLRNIGWTFVIVGLIVLIARRLIGNYTIDSLTSPASHETGESVWLIGSAILAQIGWAAILYGVVIVLGTLLAGPTEPALTVRRRIAPVLNDRPAVAAAAVAAVYLVLVLWGPTHALRVAWGILLLAALIAAGVYALRRQTLQEAL